MEGLNNESVGGLVRLLVRASNQQIDDHVVNCNLDWTVGRLKDYLEEVYPSKPKRAEQKVIFSGQLLNDSMVLKDVLQQYYNEKEETFIVHLVCPSKPSTAAPVSKQTTSEQSSRSSPTVNLPSPSVTPSTQLSTLQQYYGQLNNQQIAWMQQAYAHYLTQYMQLMAAQGIQLQSTLPYTQPPNPNADTGLNGTNNLLHNNGDDNDDQTRPLIQEDAVANAPNNNNNINNNNNAGGDDNDAGMNRDWLDVFDAAARIVVLFSVVYFYSSPSRFIIVTFLGFAIYLIQSGFFRGPGNNLADNNNAGDNNNRAMDPAPGQPAAPIIAAATPAGQQQPPASNAQVQHSNLETPETANQETSTAEIHEDDERPGALAFTWTFLSSFFTSIIPDQQHVI